MRALLLPAILSVLLACAASCGGGVPRTESGSASTAAGVAITGHVAQRGTRGSILLFAYTDLGPGDDPVGHEPASIGTLTPDGGFDLSVPPAPTLTLVFLADASNDGVVDQGDPISVLSAPELVDLQTGDRVQVNDASIDFHGHRVTAAVEITRAAGPGHTPTPLP